MRTTQFTLAVLLTLLLEVPSFTNAHEVRPAYLEVHQRTTEIYDILWKVPALEEKRLPLEVKLPEQCEVTNTAIRMRSGGAFVDRWSVRCPGSLTNNPISIDGLSNTMTDVLARLERLDGTTQIARLTPANTTFIVEGSPNTLQVASTYVMLGCEHILLGIDHLLFVLALLFIVRGSWSLIKTITAFTIAHSITLVLATLGVVHVPGPPVEAAIALSIVFVASETVKRDGKNPSLTERRPWIVAFAFGLLHGFGFAGALRDIGLPQQDIPLALFTFNVGVEIGQLVFVFAALAIWTMVVRRSIMNTKWIVMLPPYAIGIVAAYWTIKRVLGILI